MASRVPVAMGHLCFWAAVPETLALQVGMRCPVPCLNTCNGKFGCKTPADPPPLCTKHTESAQTALKQLLVPSGNDLLTPTVRHQSCAALLAVAQDWG